MSEQHYEVFLKLSISESYFVKADNEEDAKLEAINLALISDSRRVLNVDLAAATPHIEEDV